MGVHSQALLLWATGDSIFLETDGKMPPRWPISGMRQLDIHSHPILIYNKWELLLGSLSPWQFKPALQDIQRMRAGREIASVYNRALRLSCMETVSATWEVNGTLQCLLPRCPCFLLFFIQGFIRMLWKQFLRNKVRKTEFQTWDFSSSTNSKSYTFIWPHWANAML